MCLACWALGASRQKPFLAFPMRFDLYWSERKGGGEVSDET